MPGAAAHHAEARRFRLQKWSGMIFILPYLVLFVAMLIFPLLLGIRLSATRGDLFGINAEVGLDNYVRLFSDPVFLQSLANTFYFVILTVPALTVIGLALALALNNQARWAAVLRAIFFSSTVLSVTVVTLIWRNHPDRRSVASCAPPLIAAPSAPYAAIETMIMAETSPASGPDPEKV